MMAPVVPSLIVNDLLNNKDDYEDWSFRVETYLIAEGLWDMVDTDREPPRGKDKREAWDKINAKALHAIHMCCGKDAFPSIRGKDSARKAWKALESNFGRTDKKTDQGDDGTSSSDSDTESDAEGSEGESEPESEAVEDDGLQGKESGEGADDEPEKEVETVEGDVKTTENVDDYPSDFYDAIESRDCKTIMEFVRKKQAAVRKVSRSSGMTPLHAVVLEQDLDAVKELLKLMTKKDLEIEDKQGLTALHCCCLTPKGDTPILLKIAECLVKKNRKLVSKADSVSDQIPLLLAFSQGHLPHLIEYLYSETLLDKAANRHQAAEFISRSLFSKRLDPAWDLIQKNPSLGIVENTTEGCCPLSDMACMNSAFFGGEKLKFWKKWIYDRIIVEPTKTQSREPVPHVIDVDQKQDEDDQDKQSDLTISGSLHPADQVSGGYFSNSWKKYIDFWINNAIKDLFRGPKIANSHKVFGIERIYEMKKFHLRCREFLHCMSKELTDLDKLSKKQKRFVQISIFEAVERGRVEFLTHLFKVNSGLGHMTDEKDKSLFHYAVQCRQAKVLNLMEGFNTDSREAFMGNTDDDGNNMVHMAGLFTKFAQTNRIRGAALQMQKELQWFEKLEKMASPEDLEATNDTDDKPRELFTKTHIELVKEGEKSMKETATSCTVVGALMITMMFAAAFTVPGGNKDDSGNNAAEFGTPILLAERAFRVFIVSDAISLFTSTTSVMLFLGILTARYAEDDFLYALPKRMVLGLVTLFLSVSAMMIAFASALFLILPDETWISISTTILTGIPIASFMWMQFPFLIEIFNSTYSSKTFEIENKVCFEKEYVDSEVRV